MASSPCHSQQCSLERRGFRQELDSWRHKLIHCVGFESILEGLFGPRLLKDISLFEDCEPTGVSDWSFDENCLFCCLRREKVKEHLVALDEPKSEVDEEALSRQEQAKINRLEKQAEEFLNAVFQRKDSPLVADPSIPLVAREIMHRMIRQFAAEYTSKTNTSQDSIVLTSTKDQSVSKTPVLGASALNPVLSKLLMADQDRPLDLTVKKSNSESDNQDGVLDLSTKKSPCVSNVSSSKSSSAVLAIGNNKIPRQEAESSPESQTSLDQFMAKLCRHHQRQFMSVLSYMGSEASPALEPSESSAREDMAASSPAPGQQQPQNPEDPSGSQSASQLRTSSHREAPTASQLNCACGPQEKRPACKEALPAGTQAGGAASVQSPAARESCGSGTCVKSCTAGAWSSPGACTTDCNKTVSAEALPKETVNRKEISDSQLGQPSGKCAHISTTAQTEGVSSISQVLKAECAVAVAAKAQNQSLRALPAELLNLSKKLSCPPSVPGAPLVHEAIKHTLVQAGPPGLADAVKRPIKGNHVLPAGASANDCWFVSKRRAAVRDTNGRLRLKAQAPPTKTARKSTRVSVLRARSAMSTVCQYVNEHDNQCDIVYISKPITECRFDAQRSLSATRRTARKSTRGHLCNEEYWELQTVRTLARSSGMEARKGNCPSLVPRSPVTPKQALTLPVSVPAGTSAGTPGGPKVPLKVSLKRDPLQELEESHGLPCSSSQGELVPESSQTRRSQEPDAHLGKASGPQGEPARPGGQSSPESHSVEIKSPLLSVVQASDGVATRVDCLAPCASSSAVCESVEPSGGPLKDCRTPRGSPSKPRPSVTERGDTEGTSTTESSPNRSEPYPTSPSQSSSLSSLDQVGISPVNSVGVNIVPSPEQCSKSDSGSSEVLSSVEMMMSNIPGSPTAAGQAGNSVQSVNEATVVTSLTENEEANRSEQTLSLPTEATADSVMPKEDPSPQIASRCTDESGGSDPGGPPLEPMEGPCQGTEVIKCNMASGDPCSEERRVEDLDENVTDGEGEEGGSSTGTSPESEKKTSSPKEKVLSPAVSEKKKLRKKLELASSDRCLRSQQSPAPTAASPSDGNEELLPCADGLLVPCLNVKLRRGQGERGYKREVCVNRVTSVQFPMDCFNKTLLQSITDPESRVDESLAAISASDAGKTKKPTAKQVSKDLPAKDSELSDDEELMDDTFIFESTDGGQGRILEVCVDTTSAEERKVSFSVETLEIDRDSASPEGSAVDISPAGRQLSSSRKADAHKENSKWARGGLVKRSASCGSPQQAPKGAFARVPLGDKKAVVESRDLRCPNVSITEPEAIELEEDSEYLNINLSTQALQEDEDSEPINLNDSNAPEASRPKFLDWCSEDENQELITTLNAKYENIHKAWIQIEKEAPVIQKAKCKSDRLKEIWKSKKRARKARGLYDHKISPVQKLFVANFNFANICKWFMETTETQSLIIVKNVSARNPVETLKAKTFLQKNSLIGLFPSPQAERLKKHLKKFAVASPARNNWKTRALLDHAQRGAAIGGNGAVQQQRGTLQDGGGGLTPRDLFLAKAQGGLVEGSGPPGSWLIPQPPKHLGLKKPLSAWILRKYSHMRGKLHKFQHGKEQAARKHPAKHKSVCMNPLVSPKLTSQTQLDSRAAPRRPVDSKAKRKAPKASPAKEPRVDRGKSSKSEAGPPALPSKSAPKQPPVANRKTKAEAGPAKPPAPRKSSVGKANALSPKAAKKRLPGAAPKTVARGKNQLRIRDGAKGKTVKSKAGSKGKERRTKAAKKTSGSSAPPAKRRDKTATKKKSKPPTPAKRKRQVAPEAPRTKKRKLNEKKDPVPNKRKRTDAK
uniref:uncharacterized protein isoform X2 n=1 Tax=Pristiophorus japonicus TaxID=55135 RepID=UPI00398F6F6F